MTENFVRRGVRVLIPIVALAAIALSVWHYWTAYETAPPYRFDDSYMFVRYAKHLLAGYGHAWNPGGEQTYGVTSLLYVFVVTLLHWATDFSDTELIRVPAASFGFAAIVVMVLGASRFSTSRLLRKNVILWAGLLVPLVLVSDTFMYHSKSGMDTMLAVFMHSALIYVTLRMVELGTTRSLWPVVLIGYLAFLTRPDSAIYAAFFPAAAILFLTEPVKRIRLLITFWIGLGAVLAIDAGIKYAIFGVPVPLSSYAKLQGHYKEYAGLWMWNPVEYLLEFCGLVLPFACLAIGLVKRRSLPLLLVFLLPAAVTLAAYFNMVQIMGYHARFSFPTMPFVVMAGVLMMDRFAAAMQTGSRITGPEIAGRLAAVGSTIALVLVARNVLPPKYEARLRAKAPESAPISNRGNLVELSYWDSSSAIAEIARQAPAGSLFCMSEYGYIGSVAPELSIYDPLGLHDLQNAHDGFSAEALFELDPDLIWLPHPDYIALRREILAADEFWSDYLYFPAAFGFGVAIRNSGPHTKKLGRLFIDAWQEYYPNVPFGRYRLIR